MIDRIRRMMADVFEIPIELVGPSSSPDTIEAWDSLHHLSLVLALEQEFGIAFSPEEIEQLLTAELIAALVEEKFAMCGVK